MSHGLARMAKDWKDLRKGISPRINTDFTDLSDAIQGDRVVPKPWRPARCLDTAVRAVRGV